MKSLKYHIRSYASLLATLVLFQSCVVYRAEPKTLSEASEEFIRTKVVMNDGSIMTYNKIMAENGKFYGVKNYKRTELNEADVKRVRIKNRTMSTVLTYGIPLILITVAVIELEQNCCFGGIN
ncbi:hypothetical protein V8G61_06070 [Gaetbulibacter sp. M240]|uniref:hypothetical protein n=1 Tax=Gaetbulibacter sp. M240 TaxID=3126511 RepID=UPI00374E4EDC